MAGKSTVIQPDDRMIPVLQSITNSMNIMLDSFHAVQSVANAAFGTTSMAEVQQEMANASAELMRYREQMEQISHMAVPAPMPTWTSVSTPQVFMDTGAKRFAAEMQSANQMAQQLYKTQQQISGQTRNLNIAPPGMLNDVAMVGNRVQSLANQIESLNSLPVELQTDQTNGELERLRRNLSQALDTQDELNQAIGRMDISAANAAYQSLNSIIDSMEQGIRDNISSQDQFSQSLGKGTASATGLEQMVRRTAAAVVNVTNAGKIIGLADQVTQTSARLDLMNEKFGETGNLQQKIYEAAQRSRGAYQTTADTVSNLGMQAGGAFNNTDEVIAFAEQLNKTFVIAGTSAEGIDSVMLQLTQSMAAGKLQGEELNTILDNAQPIVQNIADYMGVPVEQIKQLAAEGAISADVIKNAMFAASDETNARFAQMPLTFSQVATNIKSQAQMAFQPALQQLSAMAQTSEFQSMVDSITSGIQFLAQAAVTGLDMMAQAAVWAQENWWCLSPVIGGVIAAIIAYNIATGLQAFMTGASTLALFLQIAAVQGLTAALAACPIMWIAILIGIVIVYIISFVNHVGGLKVAWLMCVNTILTAGENLKLAFSFLSMHVQNVLANMQYAFSVLKVGILNALSLLKIGGLIIVEAFLNGVIDRINSLIEFVNQIPGVSIEVLGHVELAAGAAADEAVKMQQRAEDLASLKAENLAESRALQRDYINQKLESNAAQRQREIAIQNEKNAKKNTAAEEAESGSYSPAAAAYEGLAGGIDNIAGNTGSTAGNTAAMANSMDMAEEDLKSMRDLAEAEVINRFTTAELTVNMGGITNQVNSGMDLDGINNYLESSIFEVLETAAEGVY